MLASMRRFAPAATRNCCAAKWPPAPVQNITRAAKTGNVTQAQSATAPVLFSTSALRPVFSGAGAQSRSGLSQTASQVRAHGTVVEVGYRPSFPVSPAKDVGSVRQILQSARTYPKREPFGFAVGLAAANAFALDAAYQYTVGNRYSAEAEEAAMKAHLEGADELEAVSVSRGKSASGSTAAADSTASGAAASGTGFNRLRSFWRNADSDEEFEFVAQSRAFVRKISNRLGLEPVSSEAKARTSPDAGAEAEAAKWREQVRANIPFQYDLYQGAVATGFGAAFLGAYQFGLYMSFFTNYLTRNALLLQTQTWATKRKILGDGFSLLLSPTWHLQRLAHGLNNFSVHTAKRLDLSKVAEPASRPLFRGAPLGLISDSARIVLAQFHTAIGQRVAVGLMRLTGKGSTPRPLDPLFRDLLKQIGFNNFVHITLFALPLSYFVKNKIALNGSLSDGAASSAPGLAAPGTLSKTPYERKESERNHERAREAERKLSADNEESLRRSSRLVRKRSNFGVVRVADGTITSEVGGDTGSSVDGVALEPGANAAGVVRKPSRVLRKPEDADRPVLAAGAPVLAEDYFTLRLEGREKGAPTYGSDLLKTWAVFLPADVLIFSAPMIVRMPLHLLVSCVAGLGLMRQP